MKTAINLNQVPNLSVSANIADASGDLHVVDIALRTMPDGTLIADLAIDGTPAVYGRRCIDRMPLLLNQAISGNFYFMDKFGITDPVYTGFGDRYLLIYDTEYSLT